MNPIEERLILLKEPNSAIAESYRSLRAVLSRSLAKGKRSFTIVSSWGGEGKSMVSANLAVAFSQLFLDVILIDGDLRRPTLSRVFDAEGAPGLMNLLEDGGSADAMLVKTPIERLFVLPAGKSVANPGDLLGKGRFPDILKELLVGNRCLVIDTSPISACSDALLMGSHTDGAVMVVSPDKWQGEAEAHFAQDLEDNGIEALGVVLNTADPGEQTPGSGYGYGYGYGHGYGQGYGREHEAPKPTRRSKGFSLGSLFKKKANEREE